MVGIPQVLAAGILILGASARKEHRAKIQFIGYDTPDCSLGHRGKHLHNWSQKEGECCPQKPFYSYQIDWHKSKHTPDVINAKDCFLHVFADTHCKDFNHDDQSFNLRDVTGQCFIANTTADSGAVNDHGPARSSRLVCVAKAKPKHHNSSTSTRSAIPSVAYIPLAIPPMSTVKVSSTPTSYVTETVWVNTKTLVATETFTKSSKPVTTLSKTATVKQTTTILAPPTATVEGTTTIWVTPSFTTSTSSASKKIRVNTYVVTATEDAAAAAVAVKRQDAPTTTKAGNWLAALLGRRAAPAQSSQTATADAGSTLDKRAESLPRRFNDPASPPGTESRFVDKAEPAARFVDKAEPAPRFVDNTEPAPRFVDKAERNSNWAEAEVASTYDISVDEV